MLHTQQENSQNAQHEISYRSEIDGLRAFAVLSVVGFHFYPGLIHGGYIGVDIFFVISGYLISKILIENLEGGGGNFSIKDFYIRRINRIFPALLLILITSLILGYFILSNSEIKQLSKHILGSSGFVSNFILWNESGYFDANAHSKPLLHLWSLGIEEQFYIILPILLFFLWKNNNKKLKIVVLAAFLSFIFNIFEIYKDPIHAFYSPLTRAWELLSGVTITLIEIKYSKSIFNKHSNVISILGLSIIILAIFLLNEKSSFPGYNALAPVVGSSLIILSGRSSLIGIHFFSNRVSVWFGKISYPLYLWHWVLLTFLIICTYPSKKLKIITFILSIFLSWLTYKYIESPFRQSNKKNKCAIILLILMLIVALISTIIIFGNIDKFRIGNNKYDIKNNLVQLKWNDSANNLCVQKTKINSFFCMAYGNVTNIKLAIIGDSTANHLAPGFAKIYANSKTGLINIGESTCPPLRGLKADVVWGGENSLLGKNCINTVEKIYDYILNDPNIEVIVLGFFAHGFKDWVSNDPSGDKFELIKKLFNKDIAELKSKGKRVIVTYDSQSLSRDISFCLRPFNNCSDMNTFIIKNPYISQFDNYFSSNPSVEVFKQRQLLPLDGNFSIFKNNTLLMRDNHHLSYYGSEVMGTIFQNQFNIEFQ